MKRKLVGHCGVDSGLIWIGDPCYLKRSQFCKDDQWGDFCNTLQEETIVYNEKTKKDEVRRKDLLPMESNDGVVTHTAYGDGNYPVYCIFDDDDRVIKMEIHFEQEADEELYEYDE